MKFTQNNAAAIHDPKMLNHSESRWKDDSILESNEPILWEPSNKREIVAKTKIPNNTKHGNSGKWGVDRFPFIKMNRLLTHLGFKDFGNPQPMGESSR